MPPVTATSAGAAGCISAAAQIQDKLDAADTERRKKAVEEAEMVLEILVSDGITRPLVLRPT